MTANPAFIAAPKSPAATIANGDGTTFKTLATAGSSGSRYDAVSVTNTDPSNAYVVQVAVKVSSVDYPIGEVTIPAGAGTNGSTKSVSLLNSTDLPALANLEDGLFLGASAELRVRSKTTVSGAYALAFVAVGGDY